MPSSTDRSSVSQIIDNSVTRIGPHVPEVITSIDQISNSTSNLAETLSLLQMEQIISDLFQWQRIREGKNFAKGFPGIVLTAAIGRIINPSYDPKNNFYGINPRPLFEKHIGPALRDKYKVPMGKSDPLNVAKNAKVIDEEWARGRRPEYAALAAVTLIEWICTAPQGDLAKLTDLLIWCYLSLGVLYNRPLPSIQTGDSHFEVHVLLTELINNAPAGGDTLQHVVGAVLQAQHQIFGAKGVLDGVGESVNATNTTAGKAGDFTEVFDTHLHIYEVTTKTVDMQRINESADAIIKYLETTDRVPKTIEVTFLCPLDVVKLKESYTPQSPSVFNHQGLRYAFVDLDMWILFMLERLGVRGREIALNAIEDYAQSSTTRLEVKNFMERRAIYSTES